MANYKNTKKLKNEHTFLFGEASAAIVLQKDAAAPHPMEIALFADGSGYKYLFSANGPRFRHDHYTTSHRLNNSDGEGVVRLLTAGFGTGLSWACASSGIGAAVARSFAGQKAHLICFIRDENKLY